MRLRGWRRTSVWRSCRWLRRSAWRSKAAVAGRVERGVGHARAARLRYVTLLRWTAMRQLLEYLAR